MSSIEYSKLAGVSPAWPLIVEGVNELTQDGFVTGANGFTARHDDEVLYAKSKDGDVVGCIVFRKEDWRRGLFVALSYVEPSSRKLGVFRQLWARLNEEAKKLEATEITGVVHVDNVVMHEVMKKVGRKPTWVTYVSNP